MSRREVAAKIVRMTFLLLSILQWILFLVGFGKLLISIKLENEGADPDSTPSPDIVRVFVFPMWLFGVAGPFLYITYTIRVFSYTENAQHILHCLTVFFNFFFTSGAILTINIATMNESKMRILIKSILPDLLATRLMLIGATLSLISFWIGTGIWPLFKIKRRIYLGYTELQEN